MSATRNRIKSVSRNTRSANAGNAAKRAPKNPHDAGKALAVKMLRDLELATVAERDRCWINPAERKPKDGKQWNVVMQSLDALGGNRDALEGFASVVSDYIASAAGGCIVDANTYDPDTYAGTSTVRPSPVDSVQCRDTIDYSLSKARGILYVLSGAEAPWESPELVGFALHAASDLLKDVEDAWRELEGGRGHA